VPAQAKACGYLGGLAGDFWSAGYEASRCFFKTGALLFAGKWLFNVKVLGRGGERAAPTKNIH
jgi:hypothetical protein